MAAASSPAEELRSASNRSALATGPPTPPDAALRRSTTLVKVSPKSMPG